METQEQHDNNPCYVAYCAKDHLVFASVDRPERAAENAKEVGKMIRAGFRIGKLRSAEVREAEWCDCPRPKKVGK